MSDALVGMAALGTVVAGAGAIILMLGGYLRWLSRNGLTGGGGVTRHTESLKETQRRQEEAQNRALAKLRPLRPLAWLLIIVGVGIIVGAAVAFS